MNRAAAFAIGIIAIVLIVLASDMVSWESRVVTTNQSAQQSQSSRPTLVGRQVCKECHAENFALHQKHGHASTFHLVSETSLAKTFDKKSLDGGEGYGTYLYQGDAQGRLSVKLPSQFGDQPFPLVYALGSGNHAQTMLTLTTNEQGETEGIEHRFSCYPGDRIALTPGHSKLQPHSALEYFGDASDGVPLQRCIYCHTTSGNIVQEEIIDLVANINCEKCHGPGSEHVRAARTNATPPPYSIGRETWDAESEIQLCGDCHRMPKSFTQKEIRDYSDLMTRFQPIGMLRSRCYLESGKELKCTSCHNPHKTIHEVDPSEHVKNCVKCHQSSTANHTVCPVSPDTGCIECHMPATPLEHGLQFHDHWIRVRSDESR